MSKSNQRLNRVFVIKEYSKGYGEFLYRVKITENDGLESTTTFQAEGSEELLKMLQEEFE